MKIILRYTFLIISYGEMSDSKYPYADLYYRL